MLFLGFFSSFLRIYALEKGAGQVVPIIDAHFVLTLFDSASLTVFVVKNLTFFSSDRVIRLEEPLRDSFGNFL